MQTRPLTAPLGLRLIVALGALLAIGARRGRMRLDELHRPDAGQDIRDHARFRRPAVGDGRAGSDRRQRPSGDGSGGATTLTIVGHGR